MKTEQRKIVKNRIKELDPMYALDASLSIANELFRLEEYKNAKKIFIYDAFDNEVGTFFIMVEAAKTNKKVGLPRIVGNDMVCLDVDYCNEFTTNEYGITEPVGSVELEPDLIIMPLLAFDNDRNRLGRGKGYYDRFCGSRDCIKIALAYDVQKLPHVDADEWDVKPDIIITEKETIR